MKRKATPNYLSECLFGLFYCGSSHSQPTRTTVRLSPSEVINLVTLLDHEALKRQRVIPKDDAVYEALLEMLEAAERRRIPIVAAIWVDGVFGVVRCDDPKTLNATPSALITAYENALRSSPFQFHKSYAEGLLCA